VEVDVAVGDFGGLSLILKTLAFGAECNSSSSASSGKSSLAAGFEGRVNPWLFSTTTAAALPRCPFPKALLRSLVFPAPPYPSIPENPRLTLGNNDA
jgi:hypothetical protein